MADELSVERFMDALPDFAARFGLSLEVAASHADGDARTQVLLECAVRQLAQLAGLSAESVARSLETLARAEAQTPA